MYCTHKVNSKHIPQMVKTIYNVLSSLRSSSHLPLISQQSAALENVFVPGLLKAYFKHVYGPLAPSIGSLAEILSKKVFFNTVNMWKERDKYLHKASTIRS